MFKALLLATWHDLSDVAHSEALSDRASFRRFCGFARDVATPERTAFVRFYARRRERRDACVEHGLPVALSSQGVSVAQHREPLLLSMELGRHARSSASRPLRQMPREGGTRSQPPACIIDSQSVKSGGKDPMRRRTAGLGWSSGVRHKTLEIAHGDLEPAPAVRRGEARHFVRGFGTEQSTWLVAIHSPAADKISQHRLAGGDTTALLSLIERKRGEARAALLRPVRVMSCYEAGHDRFGLHRLLRDHGIDNRVLDAASILVDRLLRRGKTDRLDVAALLRT